MSIGLCSLRVYKGAELILRSIVQAPARMKSVVMAFSQFQAALASVLNFAFTKLNAENMFGWLFGTFAIASWITGVVFLWT